MGRFLKRLLKHPGFWMFLILAAVGIGMLAPLAAPALMIAAMVMLVPAFIATVVMYTKDMRAPDRRDAFLTKHHIGNFTKKHRGQLAIVLLGLGLFITTLVCVIGFLTGGAAFMAPLFAALSGPFTAAAAAGGISLAIPVLAGFTLILASLNLTNIVKNIAAWLDSFKYDAVMAKAKAVEQQQVSQKGEESSEEEEEVALGVVPEKIPAAKALNWAYAKTYAERLIAETGYLPVIGAGIKEVLSNGFVSEAGAKTDEANNKVEPDTSKFERM
jgi:hypothetical protein